MSRAPVDSHDQRALPAAPDDARDPSEPAPSLFSDPMPETTLTYETACARIEEIIRRLDSGDAGLARDAGAVPGGPQARRVLRRRAGGRRPRARGAAAR